MTSQMDDGFLQLLSDAKLCTLLGPNFFEQFGHSDCVILRQSLSRACLWRNYGKPQKIPNEFESVRLGRVLKNAPCQTPAFKRVNGRAELLNELRYLTTTVALPPLLLRT